MKLIQVKLLEQIERIKATGILNRPETISEKFAKRSGTTYKIHSVSIVSNSNEHPIVRGIAAFESVFAEEDEGGVEEKIQQ